jgi:hypothetical protein
MRHWLPCAQCTLLSQPLLSDGRWHRAAMQHVMTDRSWWAGVVRDCSARYTSDTYLCRWTAALRYTAHCCDTRTDVANRQNRC